MRKKRRRKPGTAPGTLTPVPGGHAPKSIHVIHYTAEASDEARVEKPSDLAAYAQKKGITWVNVCGLGDAEVVAGLGEVFGLHPLALEDVLNVPQRPNVADYEDHLFIVVTMLHQDKGIRPEQVSIFVGQKFVVTFQEEPGDCLEPVRERLRKGTGELRRKGADYLMYALLDAMVDHYFPLLETLGERVEALEDEVVEKPTRATLGRIHDAKRELLEVRRSIFPLREVVNTLARDERELVAKTTRLYLRDCYDHTIQILDMVETYRELAGGLMEVYLSSVSNKMNEVMKVLTIIATIFIPLTFVTGIYGMNFDRMPELHWKLGYAFAWAVMIVAAIVMLVLFRRKGWLGGSDKT